MCFVTLLFDFQVHFCLLLVKRGTFKGFIRRTGTSTENFGSGVGGWQAPPLLTPPSGGLDCINTLQRINNTFLIIFRNILGREWFLIVKPGKILQIFFHKGSGTSPPSQIKVFQGVATNFSWTYKHNNFHDTKSTKELSKLFL